MRSTTHASLVAAGMPFAPPATPASRDTLTVKVEPGPLASGVIVVSLRLPAVATGRPAASPS